MFSSLEAIEDAELVQRYVEGIIADAGLSYLDSQGVNSACVAGNKNAGRAAIIAARPVGLASNEDFERYIVVDSLPPLDLSRIKIQDRKMWRRFTNRNFHP